jgi:hypothetical protein
MSAIVAVTPRVFFLLGGRRITLDAMTELAGLAALTPVACVAAIAIWRDWHLKRQPLVG